MATPGLGFNPFDPGKVSHVGIGLHPHPASNKINVSRETFWVSKSNMELAEWYCKRNEVEPAHVHGKDSPCFTIKFDKDGTPFKSSVFISNDLGYACSDEVVVGEDENKIYHYHILMNGKELLDPGGGVRG